MDNKTIENIKEKARIKIAVSKYEKENIKMPKRNLVKLVITFLLTMGITTGLVYAGTVAYEKIWKEPQMYNSYEEVRESLKNEVDKYNKSTVITDEDIEKIESVEQAKQKASNVMRILGYDSSKIKTVELKKNYIESAELTYVVRTKQQNYGIEIVINAETGKFEGFINNDIMYNYNSIVPDKLSEERAKEYANEIYKKLGYKEGVYVLQTIKQTPHCFRNQSVDEWNVEFYKKGRYINNKLDILVLTFVVENSNIKIDRFLHKKTNEFEYQDNDIKISKEKSIEIAKEQDRKITDREIQDISAGLDINLMNSFVYLQEKSHGTDDGTRSVESGNSIIIYNTYKETEKIARNTWEVTIKYKRIEDYSKIENIKSTNNRTYYIDATSGEIIGGSWAISEE